MSNTMPSSAPGLGIDKQCEILSAQSLQPNAYCKWHLQGAVMPTG